MLSPLGRLIGMSLSIGAREIRSSFLLISCKATATEIRSSLSSRPNRQIESVWSEFFYGAARSTFSGTMLRLLSAPSTRICLPISGGDVELTSHSTPMQCVIDLSRIPSASPMPKLTLEPLRILDYPA
ncbi:hypothetical protein ABKN59_003962 [Abortiporus biennis]